MKTILLSVLCLLLLFACSDNEKKEEENYDPPELALTPDVIINIPSADELLEIDTLLTEIIDYNDEPVEAYPLDQFVSEDYPQLYVYEIMSDDDDGNWSPRLRGLDDLNWQDISAGYLIPEKSYRTYFPDELIAGTYNVKSCGYLNLYRFVDVSKDGTVIRFQTGALETETISYRIDASEYDNVSAIPVKNLISDYVTKQKSSYTYLLQGVDNDGKDYSWSQLETAYIVGEMVIFLNEQNVVTHQEDHLISITLVPDARF